MKLGHQHNYHKGRAPIKHYANQPEIFMNLRIAFDSSSKRNGTRVVQQMHEGGLKIRLCKDKEGKDRTPESCVRLDDIL